jgi:GGDEF domain-containing protein
MDIVSIRKFLRPEQPKPENYIRFLQLLLNAISAQAVEASEIELTQFRQEVSGLAGKLTVHSTAEEIEVALGFVIRAVTGYNRMAARIAQAHVNELQTMLAMMSSTITFLSDSSKNGVQQLQVVEQNLQTASTIGDVRVLRSRLNDCLVLVRRESTRLRGESQARIAELQAGVERTANHVRSAGRALPEDVPVIESRRAPPPEDEDAPIGMQTRDAAEQLIASRISQGTEIVVTLFLIDRFAQLHGRFGSQTSDEMRLMVAQHLGEQLGTGALFKWSRSAFAAITEVDRPLQAIEQQMTRVAAKRFEKTIEEDRRMVLILVTCSCMVQKVSDADSLVDIAETLDDFVAAKGG